MTEVDSSKAIHAEEEPASAGESGGSQDRYAYYRRCCQLRRNGERCKAPAMKGQTVCYSHLNQAELKRYHDRERQKWLGAAAEQPGDPREIVRAVHRVSCALLDRSIDYKTAARMLRELRDM